MIKYGKINCCSLYSHINSLFSMTLTVIICFVVVVVVLLNLYYCHRTKLCAHVVL